MSTTPRTDEMATLNDYDRETVPAAFARRLETELADERAQVERLRDALERSRPIVEQCGAMIATREWALETSALIKHIDAALSAAPENGEVVP